MAKLTLVILLLSTAAYKIAELLGFQDPFLSSYFEDIIALPLILLIAQTFIQHANKKWRSFRIQLSDVMIIFIGFAVYFEFILPRVDDRFTADPLDVLCYASGALLFLIVNRHELLPRMNKHET